MTGGRRGRRRHLFRAGPRPPGRTLPYPFLQPGSSPLPSPEWEEDHLQRIDPSTVPRASVHAVSMAARTPTWFARITRNPSTEFRYGRKDSSQNRVSEVIQHSVRDTLTCCFATSCDLFRAIHHREESNDGPHDTSRRSYGACERGRNRVRIFPDPKTGLFQIEWRENGRIRSEVPDRSPELGGEVSRRTGVGCCSTRTR